MGRPPGLAAAGPSGRLRPDPRRAVRRAPPALEASTLLVAEPARLDLGTVRPGKSAHGTILVRNRTDDVVEVARVETSCDCLTLEPVPGPIPPLGAVPVALVFKVAATSPFTGHLQPEVRGISPDGITVLRFAVTADVRRETSL